MLQAARHVGRGAADPVVGLGHHGRAFARSRDQAVRAPAATASCPCPCRADSSAPRCRDRGGPVPERGSGRPLAFNSRHAWRLASNRPHRRFFVALFVVALFAVVFFGVAFFRAGFFGAAFFIARFGPVAFLAGTGRMSRSSACRFAVAVATSSCSITARMSAGGPTSRNDWMRANTLRRYPSTPWRQPPRGQSARPSRSWTPRRDTASPRGFAG